MEPASGDWWVSFYDETYADLQLSGEEGAASEAAEFLVSSLGLAPGASVLDQGCGVGWLSLPLAARGLRVVGVDVSTGYVARATEAARTRGLDADFQVGDAGELVAPRPMDAVVNWRTSFGYCEDDARNGRLLRRGFESLRPGGRFALDYPNVPRVLREFQDRIVRRFPTEAGEIVLLRESKADFARGMLDQRWTWTLPDGSVRLTHGSTRLYLPRELGALLEGAGFRNLSFHGGVSREPLDGGSPRCVIIATRPPERAG